MKKYDLVIIGGGFAGVGAALSAAREGASVLIVEKGNCLGGAAMHNLVNPFMPYKVKINGEDRFIYDGIFKTVIDKLVAIGAEDSRGFLEEELKFIFNDMVLEAGVDLLFHSYLLGANKKGSNIESVSLVTKSGVIEVYADYFIDATGDAQLSYLAGCPTIVGREGDNLCQPMTLCFRLGNVDVERFMECKPRLIELYKEAREKGEITNPRENILVFRTPIPNVLHFNTTRVVKKSPLSAIETTEAEIIARNQVREVYEFMKKHADGLENSYLMMTAAEIGVRESRMIVGDYVLTEEDCISLKKFEDSISACNYSIDIHSPDGTGTIIRNFPVGEYYTIPYRALIPKGVDNMLVAGRCISSDHVAQASYRIMPSVCCIGEAAGAAIALAAKGKVGVREINVSELQAMLRSHSAFLGI